MTASSIEPIQLRVPETLDGRRLDQALAELLPEHSRSRLQQWIREGCVRLEGRAPRPRDRVRTGQELAVTPPEESHAGGVTPQALPLEVIYQDDSLLVVDKPAGMVVHPGAGNPDGTLQNALLHHAPELERVPRSGLVHRLDKDTTGLLVIARTPEAHTRLVEQLQRREVGREYDAVVVGRMISGTTVDRPLARHPVDRVRMAVREGGRHAVTHIRVSERYAAHTRVRVTLDTGRTHQIRVHLADLGFPILGDPVYGGRPRLPRGARKELADALRGFRRQALHAARLRLRHPVTGETLRFEAPLPDDMAALIDVLGRDRPSDD